MSQAGFISEHILQASSLDKFLFAELTSDVPPGENALKCRDLTSLSLVLFLVVALLICQLQIYKYMKHWDKIRQIDWWEQLSPPITENVDVRNMKSLLLYLNNYCIPVQITSGGQFKPSDWMLQCNLWYVDRGENYTLHNIAEKHGNIAV